MPVPVVAPGTLAHVERLCLGARVAAMTRADVGISAKGWRRGWWPPAWGGSHQGFGNNAWESKHWGRKERWLKQVALISSKGTSSCAVDCGGFGLVGMAARQGRATFSSSKRAAPKKGSCLHGLCLWQLCFVLQTCILYWSPADFPKLSVPQPRMATFWGKRKWGDKFCFKIEEVAVVFRRSLAFVWW